MKEDPRTTICRSALPSRHLLHVGRLGVLFTLAAIASRPGQAAAQTPQPDANEPSAAGDTVQADAACSDKHAAMERALETFADQIESAANAATASEQERLPKEPDFSMLLRVEWKTKSLDIPSVTLDMKRHDIILKTPQVTMKERSISFDVPVTRMENRVLLGKPELVCKQRGLKVTCKYRSEPIITKVPVFSSKTTKISIKVPEVAMRNTSASLFLPRVTVTMRRVSLELPEFTSECWQINKPEACGEDEIKRMEREVQESQQRMESTITAAQNKAARKALGPIQAFFGCEKKTLLDQHEAAMNVFKASIATIAASVKLLDKQGAGATQEATQLASQLKQLQREALEQTKAFDAMLKELNDQESNLLATLNGVTENVTVPVQ